MRTLTRVVAVMALGTIGLAAPGCGGDTAIVLEISVTPELEAALDASGDDFEQLRVWVGHSTDDPSFFRASADAFYTTPRTRDGMAVPYRYLLEPTGELASIGPLVFAAAVGDDPDDARLPFRIDGFDVADAPMGFGDGEVRVVPLALSPPSGVLGGIDDACIVWGLDSGAPSRIAPDDDLDCDGASGTDDCDDLDPRQNNLDRDGDGTSSCAGDCMDDPRSDLPWVDPAHVHPGAVDVGENNPLACDHIDDDCDGTCAGPADTDGSGATLCGGVASGGVVCDVTPADCDESRSGDQPLLAGAPEACNARDDACDGFLPPPLPCLFSDGSCHWGQVECNELRGMWEGEDGGMLDCKPLPESFSEPDAPFAFCDGTPDSECWDSPDPVACAYLESVPARAVCKVSARSAACRPDRAPLAFPGTSTGSACTWIVVGGTMQAGWEVGFMPAQAPLDATTISPKIDECTPQLAARAHVPNPAARTVMLLVRTDDAAFGVRPVLVTLDGELFTECTGQLSCIYEGMN